MLPGSSHAGLGQPLLAQEAGKPPTSHLGGQQGRTGLEGGLRAPIRTASESEETREVCVGGLGLSRSSGLGRRLQPQQRRVAMKGRSFWGACRKRGGLWLPLALLRSCPCFSCLGEAHRTGVLCQPRAGTSFPGLPCHLEVTAILPVSTRTCLGLLVMSLVPWETF